MARTCFCPGCKSGYTSDVKIRRREGKKIPSLFSTPKDPAVFEMWNKAIPRADRELRSTDLVCELHFKPEDLDLYYETKLFNGNIHRLYRDKPRVKPGVVPCIFRNVPGHSTYVENKATDIHKKRAKRKKESNLFSQEKSKKAKILSPDNKPNNQTEKENVLMEVIYVHPILEKPSTTQPSFLKKKRKIEKTTNTSLSDSQKNVVPEPELQTSPSLPPSPAVITENHSKQNSSNKILTESYSLDNQTNNYFTPLTESVVAPAKNYSRQNNPIGTIAESSENYSNQGVCDLRTTEIFVCPPSPGEDSDSNNDRVLNESSGVLLENVVHQNNGDKIQTVVVPAKNYSRQNNTIGTIAESSENDSDQRVSDLKSTKIFVCDSSSIEDSDSNNDRVLNETSGVLSENVVHQNGDKIQTKSTSIYVQEDFVTFDFLKDNVSMFETTNSWWRVTSFDDFIVFSRWTSNYTVERRIVITKDLAVKVFLLDRETAIGCDLKKFTIDDITKLIFRVEKLKICSGVDKKDRNCSGYLQGVLMCKRYSLCLNCIKWRKEEKEKTIKRLKESANCIELLNFSLVT